MKSSALAIAFLGVIVTMCVLSTTARAEQARKNVLLIISDDLRTELGCYGSQLASTPHLDELASEGVCFERAYCQFPLCNPSRSSMLTGRRPTTTGVFGNRIWFGDEHPEFVSLPKYFRQHGYTTLRAGKIFHGGIDDVEAWDEGAGKRIYGEGHSATAAEDAGSTRWQREGLTKSQHSDRWVVLEGEGESHGDYRVADETIDYLRAHQDEPFFIGCGFDKPHSPLEAPQRFFDMFDVDKIPLPEDFAERPTVPEGFPVGSIRRQNADLFVRRSASPEEAREMIRAYLASSAWMDWNVGRVLQELDKLGLRERTIVVFWGDHGYQLGEKGKWSKAGSLWEQGARVPLIIYDPRAKGNGEACPRVVESMDIFPTLVELCGLPPAEGVEARSLVPLLENPDATWNHPAYTIWCEGGRYITGVVVRTEHWRYAEFYGWGGGSMLIDPAKDPVETVNLVTHPEHSDVVDQLSELAREYTDGHRPPFGGLLRWRTILERPSEWYGSDEAVRVADNVLLYQHENGGWGKNIDLTRAIPEEEKPEILQTLGDVDTLIDNGATHTEIRYLARVYAATGHQRCAEGCRRGIEYLLEAQYENGGWPMIYPHKPGYYEYITFNDGAMIGAMRVLRDVASGAPQYSFVGDDVRQRAATSVEKGIDVILKCQIVVDGRRTVWCAQHDQYDFHPQKARSYELPSLSGQESVGIVEFLMEIDHPSPEIRDAIQGAVDWFKSVKIEGVAVKTIRDESLPRGFDRVVVEDSSAPANWARFYEIGTNRPMYVGRDGVVKDSLAEIEHERRTSYSYLGEYANELLDKEYPAWAKKWGQVQASH